MFRKPFTLKNIFDQIRSLLEEIYEQKEARSIASEIIESVLAQCNTRLVTDPELILPDVLIENLHKSVDQLMQNKPLQYVLGKTEFYNTIIELNEHVLIPRPETEELVHWILEDDLNGKNVLDIGTGSGCIAIALAKNAKAQVHALDKSEEALSLARKNARINSTDLLIHHDNILNPINEYPVYELIVSNPPYVLESEKTHMHSNVLDYEPHLALFVTDSDPLVFYRAIIDFASTHLTEMGSLYLEINEKYGQELLALLETNGFSAELKKDISGKDRMIRALK